MSPDDFFTLYEPDKIGVMLGTGYMNFRHSSGIHGLAKAGGFGLYLLVVYADDPGTGQLSAFMKAAKESFKYIVVFEVWNPDLEAILKKWEFVFNEDENSWEWTEPTKPYDNKI